MQNEVEKMDMNAMVHLILKAVALAMGIGVAVLSVLNQIDIRSEFGMLGIGLAALLYLDFFINKIILPIILYIKPTITNKGVVCNQPSIL